MIKRANTYLCLKTEKLRFLDISNYLAPGYSHKKFLSAFGCEEQNFYFPYEFVNSIKKLNYPAVPPHECFYSTLQKSNISAQDYDLVVRTWERKGWRTLKDLLRFYNMQDVVPFVEAVLKLRNAGLIFLKTASLSAALPG